MTAYADHDAELIAHGIRLGGKGDTLSNALHAAGEPLTVPHLERIARPDLQPSNEGSGLDYEAIGMLRLYKVSDEYAIATEWFGWLPGMYATRDVALAAYGYVLGGETYGYLDDLVKRWGARPVTAEDIQGLPVQQGSR